MPQGTRTSCTRPLAAHTKGASYGRQSRGAGVCGPDRGGGGVARRLRGGGPGGDGGRDSGARAVLRWRVLLGRRHRDIDRAFSNGASYTYPVDLADVAALVGAQSAGAF